MNCKPGDLAIVIRSEAGNEGKIVRCLKLIPGIQGTKNLNGSFLVSPVWEIDQRIFTWSGQMVRYAADAALRPLDNPGDDAVDETLLSLPSPRQEVAA